MPTKGGSIKLFRLAGIDVYVHWAWFLVFIYFSSQPREYTSYTWNCLEVLGLFAIVLTHEFGHQLACRQVGGQTHDIVLWPLGGVAYVTPPQRPGAQLWSIAAGPLVNVVLIPIFAEFRSISMHHQWRDTYPNLYWLAYDIWVINIFILCFNMLPIFPLDGGQILRSLLWFVLGRARSLLVASVLGFLGVAAFIWVAIRQQSIWLGVMAMFVLLNCWAGFQQARALSRLAKLPRREGFACPSCKTAPPVGEYWRCGKCGKTFDTFLTQGICPHCGTQYNVTHCLDCGASNPIESWLKAPPSNN